MDLSDYARFLPSRRRHVASNPLPTSSFIDLLGYRVHVLSRRASTIAHVADGSAHGVSGSARAPHRVVVIHGSGGHAGALWPLAAQLPTSLADIEALDLPLYGRTEVHDRHAVRYSDWVDVICAYLTATDDGRPVTLWGFSIGGLLALECAHVHGGVDRVVASCLVDPGRLRGRFAISRWGSGALLSPLLGCGRLPGLRSLPLPMTLLADMSKMSRNPELTALCCSDPHGGGSSVPLGFLSSLLTYKHRVLSAGGPEMAAQRCGGASRLQVLLVHPARDAWTPPTLSLDTLRRSGVAWKYVPLPECGHFPVEEPGLSHMVEAVTRFLT